MNFSEYQLIDDSFGLALSTEEVNDHLKTSFADIEDTVANADIYILVKSVQSFGENFTKRDFLEKTYRNFRNSWCNYFELRKGNLVKIKSIKYLDVNSVVQTVASTNYYTPYSGQYSKVVFKNDFTFPILDQMAQAIEINFVAGIASSVDEVPADLKAAMLNHLAFLWQNRGDCLGSGAISNVDWIYKNLPNSTRMIYSQYDIRELFI